jgi:hypothetical protein
MSRVRADKFIAPDVDLPYTPWIFIATRSSDISCPARQGINLYGIMFRDEALIFGLLAGLSEVGIVEDIETR